MPSSWLGAICPCLKEPEPPKNKRRRPKIDRSMIGEPSNFVHTGHIGSGDMGGQTSQLSAIQTQMQSKGGYTEGDENGGQAAQ